MHATGCEEQVGQTHATSSPVFVIQAGFIGRFICRAVRRNPTALTIVALAIRSWRNTSPVRG